MATLTKRATIYFDPAVHRLLRVKALETEQSLSDLVNKAVLDEFAEDEFDLSSFAKREKEPTISYEALLKKLKIDGKI
ncbi:MAG: CopG family transcriptional regulator [Candidatus Omnitrophica bacterium]|nr:CopG family transcriptional regulator [Candidatus Omnitrophota bacterium]